MEEKFLFKNAALNDKYVITGADHKHIIQAPGLTHSRKLSDLNEKQVEYLIGRNSPLVALKAAATKAIVPPPKNPNENK